MGRLRTNTQAPTLIQSFKNYKNLIDFVLPKKELQVEIGCGKGDFLIQQAISNHNIYFLGIEKYSTVILKALKKIEKQNLKLQNLTFACADVSNIDAKKFKNKVSKLFLNFSDPWPKKRHEKRRLTSASFLDLYKIILKPKAYVEFKTDNADLYNYTLEVLNSRHDIRVVYCTNDMYLDLNNKFNVNNVQTEYEKKFVKINKKINKIVWQYR